jgi:hypothetical protein
LGSMRFGSSQERDHGFEQRGMTVRGWCGTTEPRLGL